MRFKIDWASLINGRKFTVFSLFYFVFESNFRVQTPWGAYIWRGDLMEGFGVTSLGGLYLEKLIHRGAYFRNFTVCEESLALNLLIMSGVPGLSLRFQVAG